LAGAPPRRSLPAWVGDHAMRRPTVLVVEDEADLRASLRRGLEAEGWSVLEAADRAAAFAALDSNPDAVTLDLTLGAEDGLALAREIRSRRSVPLVIVSGRAAPFDRVTGLEHGADDYVVKPFHPREVALRLRRLLDQYGAREASAGPVAFAGLRFDPRLARVTHADGRLVELTDSESRILALLSGAAGRVVSRDEMSRALHGRDWAPLDRTIDGHVARLRRKVEPAGEAPSLIRSVRNVGYVLTAEVGPADPDHPRPSARPAPPERPAP
jgi:DNA-binding response OmpR family regulator